MSKIENILQKKQLRITPMRLLLLTYFLEENKILGLLELESTFPRADRVTIYRTLKTFEEHGIIHRIENGNAEVKYGLCTAECSPEQHVDTHPHFHCLSCGDIQCMDDVSIPSVHMPEGYRLKEIDLQLKGICGSCP